MGKERQLLLRTETELQNGDIQKMEILVDTGAEANLIRQGLVADHLMYGAEKPLRFETANGQSLSGGKRCARVKIRLQNESLHPGWVDFDVEFYEANIKVDAILSFPWLADMKLGIFPHHKALVQDSPTLHFLFGTRDPRKEREAMENEACTIHEVKVHDQEKMKWEKLGLHMPPGSKGKVEYLNHKDIAFLAAKFSEEQPPAQIRGMIIAREGGPETEERIATLKEAILRDFGGKVLRSTVFPDPPERGRYGYAYIPLKEGAEPVRQKPFFMHGERREALDKITEQWIDMKFIEPASSKNSDWLSQTFPVPKKSASFPWRGVADLRGPNSQTRRCNYPLPHIEDILVKHGGNQMFSILDLKQAFHQQPLHPDSRHITCCFTPRGVFQWRVNVMGLTNAPQQFQQMIDDRLEPVKDIATPYIDDILVGTTVGEGEDVLQAHDRDLRRVMKTLEEEKFVVDDKAKFFVSEVEFCGQVLGFGNRRPAPGKLMAIEKWEVPKTITALRAFLGFTNYYHTYIHMYADLAARLQDKLKVPRELGKKGSKQRVEFDAEDMEVFEELKRRLCLALNLQRVNPDKPFVLRVDASGYAVGGTLEQLVEGDGTPTTQDVIDRKTVPVAFMSRKLAPGQRKWTPRELETYAIILALQKWESWIGLQPVLVLTDHQSLEAWTREVLDTPSGPVGRRARWHQIFSKFDLTVGYIPGKDNTIADVLSRWAYPASQALRDISKHGSTQDKEDMDNIIQEEREEEMGCMQIAAENPTKLAETGDIGVVTRSGKKVIPENERMDASGRGTEGGTGSGGTDTPADPHSPGPRKISNKKILEDKCTSIGMGTGKPNSGTPSRPKDNGDSPNIGIGGLQPPTDMTPSGNKSVWECDWGEAYTHCPTWKTQWEATSDGSGWPKGIKVLGNRMYFQELLCVPLQFQKFVVQENHDFLGHVGPDKSWHHICLRYAWADEKSAKSFNQIACKQCFTCQASSRGAVLKGPIESTPIPPAPMLHVAIDLFNMPNVLYEGVEFDMMAICVDRHSGWIVGVPCMNKGLTGAGLAKTMLKNHWRPFGVPSVISSDQGSHFISSWWRNMCALMGIRQAYSQAYHHQANGRVERAGQQVMEILRKLYAEEKVNWVEALPRVLDRIHDMKGESGYSPYEILFGRERPLGGCPYSPPKECEDAMEFFQRLREIDEKVASALNRKHQVEENRINATRKELPPLENGTKVWYRRPENSGEKLDSRWIGPGVVTAREGDRSYVVEVKPGLEMKAHRSFLKEFQEPQVAGKASPLYFFRRTEKEEDAMPDEWEVDKIVAHRKDKNGRWEFLTKWVGYADGEDTWEPIGNFIHRYSEDFVKYCREHHLKVDVLNSLTQP